MSLWFSAYNSVNKIICKETLKFYQKRATLPSCNSSTASNPVASNFPVKLRYLCPVLLSLLLLTFTKHSMVFEKVLGQSTPQINLRYF